MTSSHSRSNTQPPHHNTPRQIGTFLWSPASDKSPCEFMWEDYIHLLPTPWQRPASHQTPPAAVNFRRRSVPTKVTKPGLGATRLQMHHHHHHHYHHHHQPPQHSVSLGSRTPIVRAAAAATTAGIDENNTTTAHTRHNHHPVHVSSNEAAAEQIYSYDPSYSGVILFSNPDGGGGDGCPSSSNSKNSTVLSKRIGHKLSEKSRRNRRTVAIREIEKLLPSSVMAPPQQQQQQQQQQETTSREDTASTTTVTRAGAAVTNGTVDAAGGGGGDWNNNPVLLSKVDVVEMAIGYIKKLRGENEDMAKRLHVQKADDSC